MSETVQFFQFDKSGNMYMYPAGSGCTGTPRLVQPGDEMIFSGFSEESLGNSQEVTDCSQYDNLMPSAVSDEGKVSTVRKFNLPLQEEVLEDLTHKNFAPETMKKVKWVTKMFREWRVYRHSMGLDYISCDLDVKSTITEDSLKFAVVRFLTEVKKLDGTDFPPRTLYDILVCLQFHLECIGINWKLLNSSIFSDIKLTLDNLMKIRTSQGLAKPVRKAQVLSHMDEDYLWSLGLLGSNDPETLLNTMVFLIGKGVALRAGKEHHVLRRPPFNSQFEFCYDEAGCCFIRYHEDLGLKTNKGGLKHRKIEPKTVDVYPIENSERCPVRLFVKYLSMLPRGSSCTSFYMQPRKKYTPQNWYLNRPAGQNKLRHVIKELCSKAGIPGYYTNHSLRSTAATKMYHCNIDEQLIMEITGHRSLAVRNYKRTSDFQLKMASKCLFSE